MTGSCFSLPGRRRQRDLLAVLASGLGLMSAGGAFAADATPPELKALAFSPGVIDTSSGPAEVTLSFVVTDDLSGANHLEAAFTDPSGVFRQSASGSFAPTLSGSFLAKATFPRFSAAGAWTLSHLFLSDAAGNTLVLDAEALISRGFPTRLDVRSAQDTVSPKLTSLQFTPLRIDTSEGSADVKVSFAMTDDLSGANHIELGFVSPSGVDRRSCTVKVEASRSVSGSATITFPRRSEPGQWTLSTVFLSDAANNTQVLDAKALEGMGLQTYLHVISRQDSEPPVLTSLRFAPEAIDTTSAEAQVEVSFQATDNLSGIGSLEAVFVSPSGVSKRRGFKEFPSPNALNDSLKVTFPKLSEPGQWSLISVFMADAAGNTLALDADGLAGKGVSKNLYVTSAQDTAPPMLTSIGFAPQTIDTSRGPAEVHVGIRATDNSSGVQSVEVAFVSPSAAAKVLGSAKLQPAAEVNGSIRLSFPPASEPGIWRMASAVLTDAAGNSLVLDAEALASRVGVLTVR